MGRKKIIKEQKLIKREKDSMERINKTQCCFIEKINKIINPL